MKILAWVLFVFSIICVLGLLLVSEVEQSSLYALLYGVGVIAFTGKWLYEEHKK